MRWPWIKRSEHERIVADLLASIDAMEDDYAQLAEDKQSETARLRQDLIAEQNAHAVTRGRLVAEAHVRGEPAP